MYELKRQLSSQCELTKIYFDKEDAEYALSCAKDDYEDPVLRELSMEQFVSEARDAGCDDFGVFEMLLNEADGYSEIRQKASAYDKMIEDRRKGAAKINSISQEARIERAKKAAKARWSA